MLPSTPARHYSTPLTIHMYACSQLDPPEPLRTSEHLLPPVIMYVSPTRATLHTARSLGFVASPSSSVHLSTKENDFTGRAGGPTVYREGQVSCHRKASQGQRQRNSIASRHPSRHLILYAWCGGCSMNARGRILLGIPPVELKHRVGNVISLRAE